MRKRAFPSFCVFLVLLCASAVHARETSAKFGPDAIPIQRATEYLRSNPAPDYWAISPFYIPQDTDSDCSLASATILLNVLRGVPLVAEELVTPRALAATLDNQQWMAETKDDGEGVTFAEMRDYLEQGLRTYGLQDYEIEVFRPSAESPDNMAKLRQLLMQNEESDRDLVLLYFNQGVLTGDWDGPHISPIGAYDSANGRVLIMDVDRRYYVPYWSPVSKVLDSMLRPTPETFGHLRGETGGIFHIKPKKP